jgi:hypothetical protein
MWVRVPPRALGSKQKQSDRIVFVLCGWYRYLQDLNNMAKRKSEFTDARKLQHIEKFAIKVAQSLEGGMFTEANHRGGDLYHAACNTFSEVKGSGISGGAIIRKDQLNRHFQALEYQDCNYVLVFYENRSQFRGKRRCVTFRKGRTPALLNLFLAANIKEIFVVHVSIIAALYKKRRQKDERTYVMQSGPKTYVKMRPPLFKSLVEGKQGFINLKLVPEAYRISRQPELIEVENCRFRAFVSRIIRK